MKTVPTLLLGLAVLLVGCESDAPLGPDESPLLHRDRAGSPALTVVTYNVYWGAYVEELLLVDPTQIPIVAAQLWGDIQATDFNQRAEAIADQIESADAHVIGLQEIALYRFEPESDYAPGGPVPPPDAEDVLLDFLAILTDALEARGLYYDVASSSENMDIELPMCTTEICYPLADIRLTDYDVVLVQEDVAWTNPLDGNFAAALPIDIGGQVLYKPSGWASVDITYKGLPYRFVNTHLEPADMGGVLIPDLVGLQAMQLEELMGIVDASPYPVIMVGDFNSDDDGSTTATYQAVRDSGFVDAWLIGRPRGSGYTSNQAPDLMNEVSELFHRIDFIFYGDEFTAAKGKFQGSVAAELLGEEQADRTTPDGLWPSDHAGVAATLRIAPGRKGPRHSAHRKSGKWRGGKNYR